MWPVQGGMLGHTSGSAFSQATASSLANAAPTGPPGASGTLLNELGRNHGATTWAASKTNFAYVDGHVETKKIADTLAPFEWGQQFYSLSPNN
jgi:prepilin-type processing-associated H-X9-DG protein